MATSGTSRPALTDLDLHTIDQARQLLSLKGADAVAGYTGHADTALAYADAFGQAQYVMAEMVALAERLAADPGQASPAVLGSQLDRAAKLAKAITAHPLATSADDGEWTVQDVLNVALSRGLDDLGKTYPGSQS